MFVVFVYFVLVNFHPHLTWHAITLSFTPDHSMDYVMLSCVVVVPSHEIETQTALDPDPPLGDQSVI